MVQDSNDDQTNSLEHFLQQRRIDKENNQCYFFSFKLLYLSFVPNFDYWSTLSSRNSIATLVLTFVQNCFVLCLVCPYVFIQIQYYVRYFFIYIIPECVGMLFLKLKQWSLCDTYLENGIREIRWCCNLVETQIIGSAITMSYRL